MTRLSPGALFAVTRAARRFHPHYLPLVGNSPAPRFLPPFYVTVTATGTAATQRYAARRWRADIPAVSFKIRGRKTVAAVMQARAVTPL
jgi:hypothetical protein